MLYRKWNVHRPDAEKVDALCQATSAGRLLCSVLVSRGINTPDAAAEILAETHTLSDPFLLKDMDKAVARITAAIEAEEPMVIFGDYDVDGITATALLYTYLESLGAEVFYKLPSRSDDDYGLSPALVDQVADRGIKLIITVDNGISAYPAAQRAKERGVDVVVTDHHLPSGAMPDFPVIVDPCRPDDDSPFGNLSGAGVAFMLVAALEGCPAEELLPVFGDLAAIGTVADVMKLTGENRVIVRAGLAALQETERPGLVALIEACGWQGKEITVENISYGLAPRLNAAGRMDDATSALRLILAQDSEEAQPIVESLQEQNTARQKTEQEIVARITAQIDSDPALQHTRVLVVWGEGWHQGIIGIVASRLVDKYAKPAVVISLEGDVGRGSGRSVHGFSLHSAISACEDLLIRYGGHELAAGFSLDTANLEAFRQRMNQWAAENCPVPALPEVPIDLPVAMADLSVSEVRALEKLAPCGSGNPVPKFLVENATVDAVYPVSDGKHSRVRLRVKDQTLYAVLFGTGPDALVYKPGTLVDALLTLSVYEGKMDAQVSGRIIELRPAGMGNEHALQSALFESFTSGSLPDDQQKGLLLPTREDTAAVYRAVRQQGGVPYADLRPLFAHMGEEATGRALTALAALEELELIRRDEHTGRYLAVAVSEKKDLGASVLLRRLEV